MKSEISGHELSIEEADVYAMRDELAYLARAERAPGEVEPIEPVSAEEIRAAYAEIDAEEADR